MQHLSPMTFHYSKRLSIFSFAPSLPYSCILLIPRDPKGANYAKHCNLTMVSFARVLTNGLILAGPNVYQSVSTPEQASVEQYNILKYLGGAAPYIHFHGFGIGSETPPGCKVTQVQLLSRHSMRYPTTTKNERFLQLLLKLRSGGRRLKGSLEFVNSYRYFVDDDRDLEEETSPANSNGLYAGTTDAFRHGANFRARYNHLFDPNSSLPVFTTDSHRVHVSAQFFARGFLGTDLSAKNAQFVVLPEEPYMGANSLTPRYGCGKYNKTAHQALIDGFPKHYATRVVQRLQSENGGHLSIAEEHVDDMFALCAFEINVRGWLPFCGIFTNDDFVWNGYAQDVGYYYTSGEGNLLSKTIGGELLLASLRLLKEDSQQRIWLSFTHDTDMDHFHAALGLFSTPEPLATGHVDFYSRYTHAQILPQGARVYTEKLQCGNESYVRYIVNDAVVPILGCQEGPGFSCSLANFEEYVSTRLKSVDYVGQCGTAANATGISFYWDYVEGKYPAE